MAVFVLAMVFGVIGLSVFVNYHHNKNNSEYNDYLLQLDEIKKRKLERHGN